MIDRIWKTAEISKPPSPSMTPFGWLVLGDSRGLPWALRIARYSKTTISDQWVVRRMSIFSVFMFKSRTVLHRGLLMWKWHEMCQSLKLFLPMLWILIRKTMQRILAGLNKTPKEIATLMAWTIIIISQLLLNLFLIYLMLMTILTILNISAAIQDSWFWFWFSNVKEYISIMKLILVKSCIY